VASEARREANRKHYANNKEAYYKKRDKRVDTIKLHTPPWAKREKAAIKRMYKKAEILQKRTGEKYHVDHWIPLNNPIVSGLHCKDNLVVVPALENLEKGDDFDVDNDNMQDLSHLQK